MPILDYFHPDRYYQQPQFRWMRGGGGSSDFLPIGPDYYRQLGQAGFQPGKGAMQRYNKLAELYRKNMRSTGLALPNLGAEQPLDLSQGTPTFGFVPQGFYFSPSEVGNRTSYSNFPLLGLPGPSSGNATKGIGSQTAGYNPTGYNILTGEQTGSGADGGGRSFGPYSGSQTTGRSSYADLRENDRFFGVTPQSRYTDLLDKMARGIPGLNPLLGPEGYAENLLEWNKMLIDEQRMAPLRGMINPLIQSQLASYGNIARRGLRGPEGLNTQFESFYAPQIAALEGLKTSVPQMVRSGRNVMIQNRARDLTDRLGGAATRQPGLATKAVNESVLPQALASDAAMSADLLQNVTQGQNAVLGEFGDLYDADQQSRLTGLQGVGQVLGMIANMVTGNDARMYDIFGREDAQTYGRNMAALQHRYKLSEAKFNSLLQQQMEAWLYNNGLGQYYEAPWYSSMGILGDIIRGGAQAGAAYAGGGG